MNGYTLQGRKRKVTMWNINFLSGKANYIKVLANYTAPDIIFLSETKMYRPIVPYVDIGDYNYNMIQVRSTEQHIGGMAIIARKELQSETVEIVRKGGTLYMQ